MKGISANRVLGVLVAMSLLAAPVVTDGQPQGDGNQSNEGRTFGITSLVSHTVSAWQFVGLSASDNDRLTVFGSTNPSRYCQGGPCAAEAALFLPDGASISSIELEACDIDAVGFASATLFKNGPSETAGEVLAAVNTGATPGCGRFPVSLVTPHTVDNASNTYLIEVGLGGLAGATRFQAVRVYYHLQVSPAPATARFADVPASHPYFRFIEALAAAGITTGCSATPPLYCPDNPLTRGEAAVLFGKALGLHFAP